MCGGGGNTPKPAAPTTAVTNNYDQYQASQQQLAATGQAQSAPAFGSELSSGGTTPATTSTTAG